MEKDEVILIQIKLSEENVKEKILANREALIRLRTENTALTKEYAKGAITAREYAQSQGAIEKQIKAANAEIKKGEATLASYAKSEAQARANMKQLEAGVKSLGAGFVTLDTDQQNYLLSSKAIAERIADLSKEFQVENAAIKANVSSLDKLDDTLAEVQMTYNGLSAAQRENKEIGGKLLALENDLIRQQDKANKTRDAGRKNLEDYIRDIDVLGINVGATIDSFKSGAQGAATFTKAIFTGRGALIALAAVPIVAVLSGLYIILTKSQKGMDFLERATSGLSAVFSALSNKVITIGEAIAGAFENPKKAVIELGNFVEQNLINRFKAFGVILDAIKNGDFSKLGDGLLQMVSGAEGAASGLKKVYDQGVAIANLSIQIREEEIKLNTERARSEKLVEKQKQIAEDTTKSTQVRAAAARAAFAEGVKIQNAEQALQKKRVTLAQMEAKAGQGTREERKKISEEQAKYDEIAKNRIGERTELQNQLNSIEAEGAAKALENRKKLAAEEVAIAEEALIRARQKGEDTIQIEAEVLKRQIVFINAKAKAEKVAVEKGVGQAAARRLIQANADVAILEATKQTALRVSEIVYNTKQSELESSLALAQRNSKAELDITISQLEEERNRKQRDAAANIKDAEALALENSRLVLAYGRKINDARENFEKEAINRRASLAAQELQTEFINNGRSLEAEREYARKRIDLEEKMQLDLLELERKYGQISDEEYQKRLDAIKAVKLASNQDLNKAIADQDRENREITLEAELAATREGSKKQLDLKIKLLKEQREKAIENAKGEKAAIDAINKKFDQLETQATKDHIKSVRDQIIDIANQSTATLSTIVDAQVTRQTAALDQQQQALLSSAALSADARAKIEEKFQKQKDEIEAKANQKRKKIATAQNFINGAVAGIKAFAELGPIGGAIATALIAAQTIAAQVVIDSQKFAVGGVYKSDNKGAYITGPGTGTSDSINARISNGESVINAKSTAKHYKLLSAINSDDNNGRTFPGLRPSMGRTFAVQHATPAFNYGGVMANTDTNAIAAAVVKAVKGVQIYTAVTDINREQSKLKMAEVGADK